MIYSIEQNVCCVGVSIPTKTGRRFLCRTVGLLASLRFEIKSSLKSGIGFTVNSEYIQFMQFVYNLGRQQRLMSPTFALLFGCVNNDLSASSRGAVSNELCNP